MTPQEAYNKGLTDAETLVIDKITKALESVDDGPFLNPELEKVRQTILTRPPTIEKNDKEIFDILESMITGMDFNYQGPDEHLVIMSFYKELMAFLRSTVKMKNKLGVRMKTMIRKVLFDLTIERTKVK